MFFLLLADDEQSEFDADGAQHNGDSWPAYVDLVFFALRSWKIKYI